MEPNLPRISAPTKPLSFVLKGRFGDSTDNITADLFFMRWSAWADSGKVHVSGRVSFSGQHINGTEIIGDGTITADPKDFQTPGKYVLICAVVFGIRGKQPLILTTAGRGGYEFLVVPSTHYVEIEGYEINEEGLTIELGPDQALPPYEAR